jgi:hypothetical protein
MLGTCWVRAPELVDLFFGITMRLILHRSFVQRLVSPCPVGAIFIRPALRETKGNAYNLTTRLNDGIFTVHRFSVATSARLHQSECVFRIYVYGEMFDNPPRLSARGTDCFCFFVFFFFLLFECKQWGPHPPKEHSSP